MKRDVGVKALADAVNDLIADALAAEAMAAGTERERARKLLRERVDAFARDTVREMDLSYDRGVSDGREAAEDDARQERAWRADVGARR